MDEFERTKLNQVEVHLRAAMVLADSSSGEMAETRSAYDLVHKLLVGEPEPPMPAPPPPGAAIPKYLCQPVTRTIKRLMVHCSATRPAQDMTAEDIRLMHTGKGWSDIGYHAVIRRDGTIEAGRPLERAGAHVAGHNLDSIGVCMIGGLDQHGRPSGWHYTPEQWGSLRGLVRYLYLRFDLEAREIRGHRSYVWNDLDGDGKMEAGEYLKECPCFDVAQWWRLQLAVIEGEAPESAPAMIARSWIDTGSKVDG